MLIVSKKNQQSLNRQKSVTIVFGYSLFIITLLAVTLSTVIPFGAYFFDPSVKHLNIAVLLISLVAGAILPMLLAYIIGDHVTHVKNKTSHHYNGILFGVAAYWLSLLFSFLRIDTLETVRNNLPVVWAAIINAWPIFATILVMLFVAVTYARNQNKKSSVLEHRPYQLVLLAAVVGTFVYILMHQYYASSTYFVLGSIYVVAPVVFIGISYWVLSAVKLSRSARLAHAVVAVSMGLIAASLAGQLISSLAYSMSLPLVVAFFIWAIYLWLISRR